MPELYIGLMSGTSADGIDAALVDFSKTAPQLIETHYTPYPAHIRQEILALCTPGADEINRLGKADVMLGETFAHSVNELIQKARVQKSQIKAIGSHGQTIRHHPDRRFTLQICDPNIIAATTGITTVADFRRRDMALGGQGAPLVPAFHQAIFGGKGERAIVNIGGIANVTLLTEKSVVGFDTGTGNVLLDAWIETHLQKSFDQDGAWAAGGKIIPELLQRLLADDFFKLPAPKSTGREYFHLAWLKKFLSGSENPQDVQATLVELTARTIIDAIPFAACEILVCGGGAHNTLLMSRLSSLSKHTVSTTQKYGVAPDWIEAMAFAWLAKQTLEKKHGNLMQVTGAKETCVLGGVYF